MKFIMSCVRYNPLVNLVNVTFLTINKEEHVENCSIIFDDKHWRGYKMHEEFEFDRKVVLEAIDEKR